MEIIAHRGASGYAPENTIAAFKKAVEMGAKAVEFDVQMTKDEQLIVIHDYSLERTTNGTGYIMNSTLEQVQSYDAGSWFSEKFSGERIPTLEEVLDVIPKGVALNIEVKKLLLETRNIEEKILDLVIKKERLEDVLFSSFNHECLQDLLKYDGVKIGVLLDSNLLNTVEYINQNSLKSYSINQSLSFVDKDFVDEVHGQGLKVLVYTVNGNEEAKICQDCGVDAIISNYPDILNKE